MSQPASQLDERRFSPLVQLIVARVKEFMRQPEAIFWSYGFPVLIVLALGIAFRNRPVTSISVDVVPPGGVAQVKARLKEEPEIQVHSSEFEQARMRLRTARTDIVLVTSAENPSLAKYRYLYDPTRPESAMARLRLDNALQRGHGRQDPVPVAETLIEEPGSRYVDFLVPGLIGMNIMGGGLWGVGFAIVYMRIRKLLKRLVATPMRKSHFLTGVMVSRLIFLVPGVIVILVFARFAFHVVVQGGWFDLVVFILAGALAFSGIGLLVASRADTIEMVSGLMNLVMLPMWVFSGVFFSSDRFPEVLQPFIKALPLTPLIDGLRAVMLEGTPLSDTSQLVRLAWLLGWGLVTSVLALKLFRWT